MKRGLKLAAVVAVAVAVFVGLIAAVNFYETLQCASLTVSTDASFAGATVSDIGTITTADINGGTIDGTVIGGASAAAVTGTTITGTTITDGTVSLASGTVTGTWADLGSVTTVDLNGGTADSFVIGGAVPAAVTGTTITGDILTDGTISIQTGSVTGTWADLGTVTTVDVNGGTIDAAVIGGAAPAAVTGTTLTGTTITDGTVSLTAGTVTGTWADIGTVTTAADINGGTIDSTPIGSQTPSTVAATTLTLTGTAFVWDPGDLSDGTQTSSDVVVTGAALGDAVLVGAGVDVVDLLISGAVTAPNTATVTLANETGGSINLASSTWYVYVVLDD